MSVNQARNSRSKGLLLVATNPNEVPMRALQTRRQSSADTSSCAYPYAALVESRSVWDTSKLPNKVRIALRNRLNICYLELTGPKCSRRIVHQASSEVALYTTDHVVVLRMDAFRDDTESMIFHDAGSTDTTEKSLLHSTLEADNGDFWRWLSDKT